ncbi:DHH family phosphoesterase [Seongchinamella sediminis]|uniref:DHH family phosphoesterase n=1 Tax=Seongchinamella sediminis TaxID=2283635 RepID=A0A3L7DZ00_9GAMM|nr:DHH family phosphoesterase [Seongchinamella sediminis]RLQ22828.1 DHH family phosphoesterase [Seongchinamella sediminis]
MDYDVFNGDADGICALLQLRKAEPRDATLVTGVKRDIKLLDRVEAQAGDRLTVLDVSMDKNQAGLQRALAAGASVLYVDHHYPGEVPEHPALHSIINEAADVCTAALVNGHLQGAYLDWAVTGAFGDNLKQTAHTLARGLEISSVELEKLERLGVCINYNGYGPAIEDLHFDPEELYRRLLAAESALDFVNHSADFSRLSEGYAADMAMAADLAPTHASEHAAVFQLPDEPWARRVSGVYSNDLATANPGRAHAVLTAKANGNFLVSVRAPLDNKQGAAELCMQFPTGGGRAAAAGINDLPADMLDDFVAALTAAYRR